MRCTCAAQCNLHCTCAGFCQLFSVLRDYGWIVQISRGSRSHHFCPLFHIFEILRTSDVAFYCCALTKINRNLARQAPHFFVLFEKRVWEVVYALFGCHAKNTMLLISFPRRKRNLCPFGVQNFSPFWGNLHSPFFAFFRLFRLVSPDLSRVSVRFVLRKKAEKGEKRRK